MREDMAARKFNEATCRNYIRHIVKFAKSWAVLPTWQRWTTPRFEVDMSESGVRAPT